MRIYISADMEGVTGVTHSQDVIPGRSQYERFRRLLTADVNAAIEGASEAGATDFLVNEAHDGMRNILLEDLDPRAEIIIGERKPLSMMQGFEEADLVFFVGYHARADTEGGPKPYLRQSYRRHGSRAEWRALQRGAHERDPRRPRGHPRRPRDR